MSAVKGFVAPAVAGVERAIRTALASAAGFDLTESLTLSLAASDAGPLARSMELLLALPGRGEAKLTVNFSDTGIELVLPAHEQLTLEVLSSSVKFSGLAASALALWWAARAGGLAAAMLASIPAWNSFDPLPIVSDDSGERRNRRRVEDKARAQANNPFESTATGASRTLLIASEEA